MSEEKNGLSARLNELLGIGSEDLEKQLHMQSAERQRIAAMSDEEFTAKWKHAVAEGNNTIANRLMRIRAMSRNDPRALRKEEQIEVIPGVSIRKSLIDDAVGNAPPEKPPVPRRSGNVIRDLPMLFEGTKPIPTTPEEEKEYTRLRTEMYEQQITKETEARLAAAVEHQEEFSVGYVPVSGMGPMAAAERVARLGPSYKEVRPYDLGPGLQDVKPLKESVVPTLMHMMTVREEIKEVPNTVIFALPHNKMKKLDDGTVIVDETEYELAHYVNIDQMPPELKHVMSIYRGMLRTDTRSVARRMADFRRAALELVLAIENAETKIRDEQAKAVLGDQEDRGGITWEEAADTVKKSA